MIPGCLLEMTRTAGELRCMDLCIRHSTGTFFNVFKIKVQIKVKVAANARVRLSLQEVEKPKDVMEKFVFVCVESGRLSDIHLVLLVPLVTSQIRALVTQGFNNDSADCKAQIHFGIQHPFLCSSGHVVK